MIRRYLVTGCCVALVSAFVVVAQEPDAQDPPAKAENDAVKRYDFDENGCPKQGQLKLDPLSASVPDTTPRSSRKIKPEETPFNCAGTAPQFRQRDQDTVNRGWAENSYGWVAPGICHRPLYFEDVPLERYGQSRHPLIQPAVSAGRFYASVPMLPYKMWLERPGECLCVLGYDRPGTCAPPVRQRLPIRADAGAFEVAVGAAMFFLIP